MLLAVTCLFLLLGIDHRAAVIYVFCVVSMADSVWFGKGVWSKPFLSGEKDGEVGDCYVQVFSSLFKIDTSLGMADEAE